ncbi:hypothetical protein [Pontibacter sp. G13]|uniref:diacylglycerol/polyprenol kinase family protein n=1 Tax=Pontibacter sp. G13 TaxID=3074898 RepID=UPI00288A77D5|nr:hypothetical protein [Pontibacter sp. G13]WNJ17834.1 hypothetical protein RJD25_23525 [Pontibacter sp. G13]
MNQTLIPMATLAASFLTLFGGAEWIHRKGRLEAEWSRKLVHIVTGLITLAFPLVLTSHWQVLILCASFGVILSISKRNAFLPSINGIDRKSHGSILYPVSVYGCFLMFQWQGDLIWFYAPILTMAICDPIAAWVGSQTNWKPYQVGADKKTLGGSLAFLGASALLLTGLFSWMPFPAEGSPTILALFLASMATLAEGISQHGRDNFWIPVAVSLGMLFPTIITHLI